MAHTCCHASARCPGRRGVYRVASSSSSIPTAKSSAISQRSGQQLRAGDEPDIEFAVQRHHGDVQPRAVEDRPQRVHRLDLAPRKYSGTCGPGTLEMTRLCTGLASVSWCGRTPASRCRTPRARRTATSPADSVALIAELCCLATEFASAMALSRSAGSAMWVSSLENMPETWLRPGRSDLPCTDTGTIATSEESGSSPRSSRKWRSTPDTSAITTSLTLTSKWFLTFLMSSRSSWAKATLRCAVTLALNAVCGRRERRRPWSGRCGPHDGVDDGGGGRRQHVGQLQRPADELDRAAYRDLQLGGRRRRPSTGSGGGRVRFGAAQLRHQVGAGDAVDGGVVHLGHHRQPAAAADASVPATPSMTHISHSGRVRSSGSAAMCPQISASSVRPPGGGQPDPVQVAVHVKVVVLHPHRMVEVERRCRPASRGTPASP